MGTISCDFGVSDKASSPLNCSDGVGLGLKMQSSESLSKTPTMMHHRPSSSPPKQPVAGDDSGPTLGCRSIYHDASAPAPSVTCSSGGGGGAVFARTLQPFDISISNSNSNSNSTTAFKSPGMAATLGFPFTAAQWKELERQAMIYKYMVASVPVPYDLLLPISANPASHPPFVGGGGGGSIFSQLRYSTKQDPEPGRCKRTDGKKWRCSRDVAPHQKYCERHMHRGRPRSRKHVEIQSQNQDQSQNQTNKKGRLHNPNPRLHQSNQSFPPKVLGSTILPNESSLLLDTKNIQHISYKEPSRGLDWMMEGEMVTMDTSEQQWHHLMHQPTNLGLTSTEGSLYNTNRSVFHQDFGEESLSLFSYTDFGGFQDFASSDFVPLERENPRGFIDAWSNNNPNPDDESNNNKDTSVSSNGNLSPSSLTLSMAMAVGNGNASSIDEETGRIQAGQGSSLLSHVSWVGTTPGGPLAEVLRPSSIAIDSDPASPHAGNGDQISPPATTVSSPSGVLQRTMLSLSDNSVCNSPTLAAASTARPEIVAFQWLS